MADNQERNININIKAVGGNEANQTIKNVNASAKELESTSGGLAGKLGDLGSDFKGLTGSATEALSSIKNISGAFAGLAGFAVGAVAAVVAVTAALEANSLAMANAADAAGELADKLGITTEKLQILQLIADENSGSVEGMQRVYDKLSKSLAKADDDNLKTINAFRALGTTIEDLAGLSETEIAGKLIDNWEAMGRTAEGTAALMTLLGPSFREQIPAIKAAGDSFGEYAARVKKYSRDYTEDIKELGAQNEVATSNIKLAWHGLQITLADMFGSMTLSVKQWAADTIKSVSDVLQKFMEARKGVSLLQELGIEWDARVKEMKEGGDWRQYKAQGMADARQGAAVGGGRGTINPPLVTPSAPTPLAPIEKQSKVAARDPFKEMLDSLKKQGDLIGENTALAKVQWEIENGAAKSFTASQKIQLENAAKAIDLKNLLISMSKNEAKMNEEDRRALEKKRKEYEALLAANEKVAMRGLGELAKLGQDAVGASTFASSTTGMSAIDRDTFRMQSETASQAAKAIAQLNKELENYDELVAKIRVAEKEANDKIKQSAEDRKAYQADWLNGAKEAFASYADSATNMAELTKNAFTNAFGNMENALVNFVMTGKLNFAEFAKSVIADIVRILAKQALLKFIGWAFGTAGADGATILGTADRKGAAADGGTTGGVGRSILVGEKGPELFRPSAPGVIVPNNRLATTQPAGMTMINNITIQTSGDTSKPEDQQKLGRLIVNMIDQRFTELSAKANRPGGMNNRVSMSIG